MSVSHSKFSFAKSERFKQKQKEYKDIFYDLPDSKDKRFAGIGYGKKHDICNLNVQTPSPCQYKQPSIFKSNSERNLGISIAIGREQVKANSYIPKLDSFIGPKYLLPGTLNKKGYSISGRHQELTQDQIPGPGQYPIESSLQALGKYSLSNMSNSRCSVFNPPESSRFKQKGNIKNLKEKNIPGPSDYNPLQYKEKGQYLLSIMKSQNPSTFTKKKREFFNSQNKNPGPGAYQISSIFQ